MNCISSFHIGAVQGVGRGLNGVTALPGPGRTGAGGLGRRAAAIRPVWYVRLFLSTFNPFPFASQMLT